MVRRRPPRRYAPTGKYLLKGTSWLSVYETYNEAYYDLVEYQDKFPGDNICITPQMGIVRECPVTLRATTRTSTPGTDVITTPPLPLDHYHYTSGWIYAVCEQDVPPLVKIGTTRYLHQRMTQLIWITHHSIVLLAAVYVSAYAFQVERALHKRLVASHIEGEWFYMALVQRTLEELVTQAVACVGTIPPQKPPEKKRKRATSARRGE
jgi:hypothetical protein